MSRVNRILLRRSGTLNMFRKLGEHRRLLAEGSSQRDPAGCGVDGQRLVSWLPLAGGRRSPHGRGRISTVPPAAVMAASADFEKRVGLHA